MQIDEKLINACRKGHRASQVKLYELCYPSLMSVCLRYRKSEGDASEIVNIGMFKVLKSIGKYDSKTPFMPWVKRIVINTIIDEYRKNKNRLELQHSLPIEELNGRDKRFDLNDAVSKIHCDEIWKMIKSLPEGRLEIFNLIAIDGFTYREVGEELGLNENTLKWHVAEARKQLKKQVGEYLYQTTNTRNEHV